jgi:hypothetical protein
MAQASPCAEIFLAPPPPAPRCPGYHSVDLPGERESRRRIAGVEFTESEIFSATVPLQSSSVHLTERIEELRSQIFM